MTGLLILPVFGLWIWVSVRLASWVCGRARRGVWQQILKGLVALAIVLVPLTDEIIGGVQFRAMCREHAVLRVSSGDLKGKVLTRTSQQSFPNKVLIDIERWDVSYVDSSTGAEVIGYAWLRASGGLLSRSLLFSSEAKPLTVHPSTCQPPIDTPLEVAYGFSLTSKQTGN